jgi:beta-phosphoglucomutase-like phosphatase (HAD superfamily)
VSFGLPDHVRACLFDLDGVLTDTASVHRKAWKAMFDAFLRQRAHGGDFTPFDIDADYLTYVDGKTREDGVRSFLASRDITLPEGSPDDDESAETVYGLGNRKNAAFQHTMHTDGIEVFEGSRTYLRTVKEAGLAVAVVSSSANTREVLALTGLDQYVDARVEAGRAGHFGIVVGVDRVGHAEALRQHGADVVVTDLADLLDAR